MKEVTSILTLKITSINKMTDEEADEFVKNNQQSDADKATFAELIKEVCGADDVVVEQVQDFVREMGE